MKKEFLILFFFVIALLPAKSFEVDSLTQFSLITCSSGDDLYSIFGHSALRVKDEKSNQDVIFNYGTFSFSEDFYIKFAMGKLDYTLSAGKWGRFLAAYQREKRSVYEQVLLLSVEQKQKLLEFLEFNYLPENRIYPYEFYYNNCSTKIKDALKEVLGSDLVFEEKELPQGLSFRNKIDEYLIPQPWSDFGIDIALGLPCDTAINSQDLMFLPNGLMEGFSSAKLNGKELVAPTITHYQAPTKSKYQMTFTDPIPLFWIGFFFFLIITILEIRMKKRILFFDRIYFFTLGLIGLLVTFLWFITNHTQTVWNFNLLWALPTGLILVFGIHSHKKWIKYLINITFLSSLIGLVFFWLIPQQFHLAFVPIMMITTLRLGKQIYPLIFK